MKKNKVSMALVLGAVSAIVAAPSLLNSDSDNLASAENQNSGNVGQEENPIARTIIDIKKNNQVDMPEEEKVALVDEVNELLKRNVSTEDLSDGLSLVLAGYGENNITLEQEVYNELTLAFNADSTYLSYVGPSRTPVPPQQVQFCHAACHYACHGSRGWR